MGSATGGVLVEWVKFPGDMIKVGEVVCYIETDQVTADVRSPVSGLLIEHCVREEQNVVVGGRLSVIDMAGDASAAVAIQAQARQAQQAQMATNPHSQAQAEAQARANAQRFLEQAQAQAQAQALARQQAQAAVTAQAQADQQARAHAQAQLQAQAAAQIQAQIRSLAQAQAAAQSHLPSDGMHGLLGGMPPGLPVGVPAEAIKLLSDGAMLQQLMAKAAMQQGPRPAAAHAVGKSAPTFSTSPASASTPVGGEAKPSSKEAKIEAKRQQLLEEKEKERKLEELRCHLHKKPNKACKYCQRFVATKTQLEDDTSTKKTSKSNEAGGEQTFNCSPLLKEQVLNCSYYKSLFSTDNVDDLIKEIVEFAADTMDVYRTSTEPSCFMCCVYRLFTLSLSEDEQRRIIDHQTSTLVRCVGFLYLRYIVPPEQLWDKFEEFTLDDAKIDYGGGNTTTVGEYIEDLLLKEKYFTTPLPRIPASVRRKLEEVLAPMPQYRKRHASNRKVFSGLREIDIPVEYCDYGNWRPARAIEVVSRISSRLKVRVQVDGQDIMAPLGKIILMGAVPTATDGRRARSRSRSPSHTRQKHSDHVDWSRNRGKSDALLIEELRERARVDAVCSNRKDYARRLPRFESGLAIKREKGSAEAKLIEDETFIAPGMRRRSEESDYVVEDVLRWGRTAEEDERQKRMKDIYEKYGGYNHATKGTNQGAGSARPNDDIEGPDTMRFG